MQNSVIVGLSNELGQMIVVTGSNSGCRASLGQHLGAIEKGNGLWFTLERSLQHIAHQLLPRVIPAAA